MSETFADYIASERERITNQRRTLSEYVADYQRQLADLDREFAAIDAYEAHKTGRSQKPKQNGVAPRARKGERREAIISFLGDAPNGMTRSELLQATGVKGDKKAEMSVSNALLRLSKQHQVNRSDNGRWYLAA